MEGYLHAFLTSAPDEVVSFMLQQCPLDWTSGGPQNWSHRSDEQKNVSPSRELNRSSRSPTSYSYLATVLLSPYAPADISGRQT
jgi:hypothetical protein